MRILALLGKGFLILATMAFLTGVSLFVIGAFLATWPVTRINPRHARLQALTDTAMGVVALARTFDTSRPSSPNSEPCAPPPEGG